ncbi:FecR family protein [Synechococcus sp. A15-28]|uniref:FecR family protein n=1 Tax=Synechococcus sp. A15-28 TaxID=1050638 RepID=UPI001646083C|nr:FecR family protein [Synechococcus sp. A15-28]QNI43582.1 putative FecR family protein [Synechococcus sp. A15-28]
MGSRVRTAIAVAGLLLIWRGSPALATPPQVVEVPAGPAFVQRPGEAQIPARQGQSLIPSTLLRTSKPGRMQVKLSNGRQFRMGGDAKLKLAGAGVELLKGSIIGWISPSITNRRPFQIRTRLATASIQGTTVFLELNDDTFRVFSWEGAVQVRTKDGEEFTLQSGQQLLLDLKRQLDDTRGRVTDAIEWEPPAPMANTDIDRRMKGSALINGFSTPLDTLPIIERELGTSAAPRD